MKYRIGVVGWGYVGKGMHRLFEDWVEAIYDPGLVEVRDMDTDEISYQPTGMSWSSGNAYKKLDSKEGFKDVDLVIICVPTPSKEDGSCDTSIVESSVKWLTKLNPDLLILVKSTVVPSEAERIKEKYKARMVISPELLGEGNYFVPFWKYPDPKEVKYHTFQIFGGDKKDTSECVDIFIKKMGPHVHFYQTDLKTAALAKFMENSWGAMKVTFCNEWYEIAKAYGVDYNELRELWAADSRVERMHSAVFVRARGYGGKCFVKDVKAIIRDAEKKGYKSRIMKAVDAFNKELQEK